MLMLWIRIDRDPQSLLAADIVALIGPVVEIGAALVILARLDEPPPREREREKDLSGKSIPVIVLCRSASACWLYFLREMWHVIVLVLFFAFVAVM